MMRMQHKPKVFFYSAFIILTTRYAAVTEAEKTLCEYRNYEIPSGMFPYQRIEAASHVECVERCVENWSFCRSVAFITARTEHIFVRKATVISQVNESGKAKSEKSKLGLCQFYADKQEIIEFSTARPVESSSLAGAYRDDPSQKQSTTILIEITDPPCRAEASEDDQSILNKITPAMKKIISSMSGISRSMPIENKNKSNAFVVIDGEDDNEKGKNTEGEGIANHPSKPANSVSSKTRQHPSTAEKDDKDERGEQKTSNDEDSTTEDQSGEGRRGQKLIGGKRKEVERKEDEIESSSRLAAPIHPVIGENFSSYDKCQGKFPCNRMRPCPRRPFCHPWQSQQTKQQPCLSSCGNLTQSFQRNCRMECKGESKEEGCQQMTACNQWSEWGPWSPCSVTCGGKGKRVRERHCRFGSECKGSSKESEECGEGRCPHWTAWREWGPCSVSCGKGIQSRERKCVPANSLCEGDSMEHRSCERGKCPKWTEWGEWTDCSKTCEKLRERKCINGIENNACKGANTECVSCNTQSCPEWSQWTGWSQCSQSCGGKGTRIRSRDCFYNGFPSRECIGTAQDQSVCELDQCPFWGEWSSWSKCSSTCGQGHQKRTRNCEPNGWGCTGGDREIRFCQLSVCPYYDQWTEWSPCSVSCNHGISERRRKCITDEKTSISERKQTSSLRSQPDKEMSFKKQNVGKRSDIDEIDLLVKEAEENESTTTSSLRLEKDGEHSTVTPITRLFITEGEEYNYLDATLSPSEEAIIIERNRILFKAKESRGKQNSHNNNLTIFWPSSAIRRHIRPQLNLGVAQSSPTFISRVKRTPAKGDLDLLKTHLIQLRRPNNQKRTENNKDENLCDGPDHERRQCYNGPCCSWSQWNEWSECQPKVCPIRDMTQGTRQRSRMCKSDPDEGRANHALPYVWTYSRLLKSRCEICQESTIQRDDCIISSDQTNTSCFRSELQNTQKD